MHICYSRFFPDKVKHDTLNEYTLAKGNSESLPVGTYMVYDLYPIHPKVGPHVLLNVWHSQNAHISATLQLTVNVPVMELELSPRHLQSPEAHNLLNLVKNNLKPADIKKMTKRLNEVQKAAAEMASGVPDELLFEGIRNIFINSFMGDEDGVSIEQVEAHLMEMMNAMMPASGPRTKGKIVPFSQGKKAKQLAAPQSEPVGSVIVRLDLVHSHPPIWRRIQIPTNLTLTQLHEVIQIAMDWSACHLWSFTDSHRVSYTPADEEDFDMGFGSEDCDPDEYKVGEFLQKPGDYLDYVYDFGDSWRHRLKVEKTLQEFVLPQVLKAVNACPPEDCGGIWGYAEILEILQKKRKSKADRELLEYVGEDFDPTYYDLADVNATLKHEFGKR